MTKKKDHPHMGLSIEDIVEWESQAAGVTKKKTGTVVAVVTAGKSVRDFIPEGLHGDFGLMPREHESYLVRIGDSKEIYWPRVSSLRIIMNNSLPDELPGIPPPGPLHTAVKKFVTQRLKIEDEKSTLKTLGEDIMDAMNKEGIKTLRIPIAGDTFQFNVASSTEKLRMHRVRKQKKVVDDGRGNE